PPRRSSDLGTAPHRRPGAHRHPRRGLRSRRGGRAHDTRTPAQAAQPHLRCGDRLRRPAGEGGAHPPCPGGRRPPGGAPGVRGRSPSRRPGLLRPPGPQHRRRTRPLQPRRTGGDRAVPDRAEPGADPAARELRLTARTTRRPHLAFAAGLTDNTDIGRGPGRGAVPGRCRLFPTDGREGHMSQRSDLRRHRAMLESAWSRWVPQMQAAGRRPLGAEALRQDVTESWLRSLHSVDPAQDRAPVTDGGAVHHRWLGSPLRRPVDGLTDELRAIAEDAGFVTAVTDETGTILWTCGGRTMRRRAERVNFAPGGRWDEGAMGTNALSLALRTGRPSSVFSAEHLVTALHGWVCYCAPVHGPDGRVLGVLDMSTTWDRSNPLAMRSDERRVGTEGA